MLLRNRFKLLAAGLVFLLSGEATLAHSFDRNFASARYAEEVDADGLRVLVVVELPTLDVLGDFRRFLRDHPDASDEENTEQFRLAQLDLIGDSFALTVDGSAGGSWQHVESPANGLGDADFFVYMIEQRLPTPKSETFELELLNRLQPAKVVFMSSRAEGSDGWRVLSDSATAILADGLDGEVVGPDVAVEDASAKWSTSEEMRVHRVVFSRDDSSAGAESEP